MVSLCNSPEAVWVFTDSDIFPCKELNGNARNRSGSRHPANCANGNMNGDQAEVVDCLIARFSDEETFDVW